MKTRGELAIASGYMVSVKWDCFSCIATALSVTDRVLSKCHKVKQKNIMQDVHLHHFCPRSVPMSKRMTVVFRRMDGVYPQKFRVSNRNRSHAKSFALDNFFWLLTFVFHITADPLGSGDAGTAKSGANPQLIPHSKTHVPVPVPVYCRYAFSEL